jgi:hypothetical protein
MYVCVLTSHKITIDNGGEKKTPVGKRNARHHTRMSELCGEVWSGLLSFLATAAKAFKPKFISATIY